MQTLRSTLLALFITFGTNAAPAAASELPPPYTPQMQVSGTIRIWGHGAFGKKQLFIEKLVLAWEAGFQKYQPNVQFETRLYGTASAIGALYTGAGDLAVMGREIWPTEISAYEEVFQRPPTGIDIVTGSYDIRNHGYAVVFFVNRGNPLTGLTLKQLDSVFSAEHRRGGPAAKTWGDLGLTGAWKDRPLHLYGLPIARGFAEYIEEAVFGGSRIWNPDLREFADQPGSKGGATDGGQMMLDALAKDPDGIGYAGLVYHNESTKPLAIAADDTGAFVPPTRETVLDHTYPLTRMITAYYNREPGKPIERALGEFLRYVLSREAQEAVLREGGGYLPMIAPFAAKELEKLD